MVLNEIQSKQALVAFHGDATLKAFYLDRLRSHVRQDEIVQGVFGWTAARAG